MLRDDLLPKHPINRTGRIADLVPADARAAISCHACFVAVNDQIRSAMDTGSRFILFAPQHVTSHCNIAFQPWRNQ